MKYLKDGVSYFIKITEHNNIGFDCKVIENKDGKKDGKETITNSKEEISKKKA